MVRDKRVESDKGKNRHNKGEQEAEQRVDTGKPPAGKTQPLFPIQRMPVQGALIVSCFGGLPDMEIVHVAVCQVVETDIFIRFLTAIRMVGWEW